MKDHSWSPINSYLHFAFKGVDGRENEVMVLVRNFQSPMKEEEESSSGVKNLHSEAKRNILARKKATQ